MKKKVLLFTFLSFMLASCSTRIVDFTIISSKNHNLRIDKALGQRVSAKSIGFLGLGANIKSAMDKALQSAGNNYDLLVDGVVSQEYYFLAGGWKVEGTAIKSYDLKAALGKDGYDKFCIEHQIYKLEDLPIAKQ